MTYQPDQVEIAIVGAGLAGVGMAIGLKQDGTEDFVVLERDQDLGGTWRDNSYPGCACDIPSILYCYADEPNARWSRAFAPQPEIRAYMSAVAERYRLGNHFRFGHELQSARRRRPHGLRLGSGVGHRPSDGHSPVRARLSGGDDR
jgi:cation diffusion facilitator CzcD-associated flavoprotein CzcO